MGAIELAAPAGGHVAEVPGSLLGLGTSCPHVFGQSDHLALAVERVAFLIACLEKAGAGGALKKAADMQKASVHFLAMKGDMLAKVHDAKAVGVGAKTLGRAKHMCAAASLFVVGRDACLMLEAITQHVWGARGAGPVV